MSGPIFKGWVAQSSIFLDYLTPENGTESLDRNVGNHK
jgi:hypothetical protein